jgi:enoyl-CoA hydratase
MKQPMQGFEGGALSLAWPEPGLAWVNLTRGSAMNTLTLDLISELDRALDEAQAGGARVFVVTGQGRAFCCGAHLQYFTDPESPIGQTPRDIRDRYVGPIARVFDRLETMPFVTIAAINGYALGGGFELALSCDLRIMSETARVGLPEVHVGALPAAGGVQKLQQLIGRGKALEVILLARHLESHEAVLLGLVTAVTPLDRLHAATMELVAQLRRGGPHALAAAKASIYDCEHADRRSAREIGLNAVTMPVGTEEWQEGMAAFVEKRLPRFQRVLA